MKKIMPWVNQELESFLLQEKVLEPGQHLSDLRPLNISDKKREVIGTSYKQPWIPENAQISMRQNGLYEAGAVLFWIDPEVADEGNFRVPSVDPTWGSVCGISETQFKVVGEADCKRIMFVVALFAMFEGTIPEHEYVSKLTLLGGHAFVYAWYHKMYKALEDKDFALVRMLVEAALTVTLTVWSNPSDQLMAVQSMVLSEAIRVQAKVMCDSFISIMDKVVLSQGVEESGSIPQQCVASLQKMHVRFNGGLFNLSMLKAMNTLRGLLTDRSRELLSLIERRFGFEVLTGSYNKLRMLANGCHKSGSTGLEWCLETMYMALLRKNLEPGDFKNETFLKGKDGTPSWITMALTQKTVAEHLKTLAEGVAKVDEQLSTTLMEKVVAKTANPLLYHVAFPMAASNPSEDEKCDDGGDDSPGFPDESPGDLVAELGSSACRGAVLLAEAYRKNFDGTYDEGLEGLSAHACPETALAELDVDTLKATMATDLKELLRSLHAAENVVKASTAMPSVSLRTLVRQHSDGADPKAAEAERADVWRRAQAQRRKLVTLGVVKDNTSKAAYQEVLKKKGGEAAKFVGQVGEEHRLFVMSADLVSELGQEPWKNSSVPDEKVLAAMLDFLSGSRGVADATLGLDGCMRAARRTIDTTFGEIGNASELFVVYNNSWNEAFKKKILFGSDNCEVGYIAMPGSRTRVQIREREQGFNGSGETSSHFRSMSGVKMPARLSLPRISTEDKKKIFSDTPEVLPKNGGRLWRQASLFTGRKPSRRSFGCRS